MDKVLNYKDEITRMMEALSHNPRTVFIGQTVKYPGSVMSETLKDVPDNKKIEFPVAEELQMGVGIGMALASDTVPILIYPRIDFLLCAINQLSNHLDVMKELTHGEFHPKVIIRTIIGATKPLYPGIQHCRDLTDVFKTLLKNVMVLELDKAEKVMPVYNLSFIVPKSVLIIERAELY